MSYRGQNSLNNSVQIWNGSRWAPFELLAFQNLAGTTARLNATGNLVLNAPAGDLSAGATNVDISSTDDTNIQSVFGNLNITASTGDVDVNATNDLLLSSSQDTDIQTGGTANWTATGSLSLQGTGTASLGAGAGGTVSLFAGTISLTAPVPTSTITISSGNTIQIRVGVTNLLVLDTSTNAPSNGQVLAWNSANAANEYITPPSGGGTISTTVDANAAVGVVPAPGADSMETYILTNTSARTIALPASATDGVRIGVKDGSGSGNAITVSVDGGGTIDFSSTYTISTVGGSAIFQWDSASAQWWVL